jgi:two-component system nitrogen regulation sensor histidine kinase GlnL
MLKRLEDLSMLAVHSTLPFNADQFLLDNLKTAVVLLDARLCVLYLNTAAETLLEISASRLKGARFVGCFADPVPRETLLRQALAEQQPYTERVVKVVMGDGREVTVDYTVTPLQRDGPLLLLEIQPMDRSMRIDRERALLSANDTSRNLVRGLAHEIKNPLGGILGASQLLAQELGRDDLREYTDIIIAETERLRQLVDRLLGPSLPAQLVAVNVHEITERAAALVEAETSGRLRIVREYDPSIPGLYGDRGKLIQAVLNLVRNAMQAVEASGQLADGSARIVLRTRVVNHFTIGGQRHRIVCRLDIIDNGPGIPEDIHDRIFYPLVSGRPEGSGLGLPIAQSAIHLHHGLIECDSVPGRTRFSIYLPIQTKHGQRDEADNLDRG